MNPSKWICVELKEDESTNLTTEMSAAIMARCPQPITFNSVFEHMRQLANKYLKQMFEPQVISRRIMFNPADFLSHFGQLYGGLVRHVPNPECTMIKRLIAEKRCRQLSKSAAAPTPTVFFKPLTSKQRLKKRLQNQTNWLRGKQLAKLPAKPAPVIAGELPSDVPTKAKSKDVELGLVVAKTELIPSTLSLPAGDILSEQLANLNNGIGIRLRNPDDSFLRKLILAEKRRRRLFKPYEIPAIAGNTTQVKDCQDQVPLVPKPVIVPNERNDEDKKENVDLTNRLDVDVEDRISQAETQYIPTHDFGRVLPYFSSFDMDEFDY